MCSTWIAPLHYVRINSITLSSMQRRMQSVWTFFALRFFHSHLFTALKKFQWIWTNVDSNVENWKEKKKLWGWETQIDWFSYYRGKKYTNGFCCRYNIFFHSSDLNERKKIVYNKGYRKNYSNIYGTLQTKTHSR